MRNKIAVFVALTTAVLVVASAPSWAQKLYKWVDEKGEVHYGDKIPPEYVNKPNQELDNRGITRKTNEGLLTPEQQRKKDEDQKKADQEKQRILEGQRQDRAILTTYNNVQEIDIARDKELKQAEDAIQGIKLKISDTQELQVKLQKDIDSYKGKKVPPDLKASMTQADQDLRDSQQLAVSKRKETDNIRAKYAAIRQRYVELTGGAAADDGTAAGKTK